MTSDSIGAPVPGTPTPEPPHGLPAGVTLRPARLDPAGGDDLAAAHAVVVAHEAAVCGTPETTEAELRILLAGPLSPADAQVIAERGGAVVGVLSIEVEHARREVFADAFAVPGSDAQRLLAALVAWAGEYARAVAAADPDPVHGVDPADPYAPAADHWQLLAGSFDTDDAYRDALRSNGLRPIRRHWQMHLDLAAAGIGPDDPHPPDGIERREAADETTLRAVHAVYAESFRDHFGAGPLPYDDWVEQVRSLPGADPSRWWLAVDRDAPAGPVPVGFCLLDDSRVGFGDGYVRSLGVVRAARGRGIARWLLGCAFADAARRGLTGVALTVDSASPTGATRLYEGMGMARRRVIDAWCRPVPGVGPDR